MQATATLRRPGNSRRMVAFWVTLAAVVALGGAAGFAAKSNTTTPLAPAASQSGTPVCDSSMCDVNRYVQAPAAEAPNQISPLDLVP